ncbi:MAG TPA: hypothetical protein VJ438_06260 [Candidatus Nanoarchaeia archaeon]|nr:hypothetical protein [Candidatus Nanoarchaeia archaeon]
MKKLLLLLIALMILPSILAIDVTIEKEVINEVVVSGLNEPAQFEFEITNHDSDDEFYFYNLLGFTFDPKESFSIGKEETKKIRLTIYPREDIEIRNYYTFPYYLRASDSSEVSNRLTIKLIDLEDAFEITADELSLESSSVNIYIHNKESFDFKDLEVKLKSKFFEKEEKFDLPSNEKKEINIQINKDDFNQLTAGFYTLNVEIKEGDEVANIESVIKFAEKDIVEVVKKEYGLIVSTKIIQKINEGNTIESTETVIEKNIISRLFTSFSPEPDVVDRKGATIYYTWDKEIKPGETLEIIVKTNWLLPFLIILFIVIIVSLVWSYTKTDVVLKKKVSFVKAKGGEFALKVSLFVYAKKYVERVNIVDRIPSLMKLYNRFGGENPTRINESSGLLEWGFEKLEQGEVRTLSYIIYSKNVGVIGKFALPSAAAIYQRDGEIKESESNRAFFVSEQRKEESEE